MKEVRYLGIKNELVIFGNFQGKMIIQKIMQSLSYINSSKFSPH
jgi:hypothetical protein